MLKQKLGAITQNTLIPISLVIALGTIIYFVGGLATKVDAMVDKDSPSRAEYNAMCEQLSNIETGVKDINTYLINTKTK